MCISDTTHTHTHTYLLKGVGKPESPQKEEEYKKGS